MPISLRRFLWLWLPIAILGLSIVLFGGLVISLRQWPTTTLNYLPTRSLLLVRWTATEKGRGEIDGRMMNQARRRIFELSEVAHQAEPDDPSTYAVQAYAMMAALGAGYDHRMPSPHKRAMARSLDRLLKAPIEDLSYADQAVIQITLAEAYAMTMDPTLRAHVEAGYRRMMDAQAEERWSADCELAALVLIAGKSSAAGGIQMGDGMVRLKLWWYARDTSTPWMVGGRAEACPPWKEAGWNGLFAANLGASDVLDSLAFTLPPPEQQGGTWASWWCSSAAFQQGQIGTESVSMPMARNVITNIRPMFRPWLEMGRSVTTADIRSWSLAVLHTHFFYRSASLL